MNMKFATKKFAMQRNGIREDSKALGAIISYLLLFIPSLNLA